MHTTLFGLIFVFSFICLFISAIIAIDDKEGSAVIIAISSAIACTLSLVGVFV
jgi:hypothetical protein